MHETESPAPANVVLTREDAHFLAVRLRRLCAHLNYTLPKVADDDASLINIAGTVIGALLTNLTHDVQACRVLDAADPFCPKCGHNRDKSSVSSIDHGEGRKSCQKCGAEWVEPASGVALTPVACPHVNTRSVDPAAHGDHPFVCLDCARPVPGTLKENVNG